jgi:hypothetical protein
MKQLGQRTTRERRLLVEGPRTEPALFNFYENGMQSFRRRNNSRADDLLFMSTDQREAELPMPAINESGEELDRPTSLSICRAIGERLRQNLRPEHSELPSGLRNLIEELQRQERRN